MSDNNKCNPLLEYLRLLTPLGILILGFYINSVKSDIKEIDSKIFKHLTNDELHAPRSLVVTKPEFLIYQDMRDKQMTDIKKSVDKIEYLVERHTNK